MWDILQRPHIGLRSRRAAADQEYGRACERGIGHGGDGVGHARAGGDHGDAKAAHELRMRMRHMHSRSLVANVDNADALSRHMVPDRLNVSALQAEHSIDAPCGQKARDPGGARVLIGVQVLRRWKRLGHACLSLGRRSASAALLLQSQQAMLNLAGRRARHLVVADEAHGAWPLVACDTAVAPFDDLGLGRTRRRCARRLPHAPARPR